MAKIMSDEQFDELLKVQERIALANEHSHKCLKEISETIKELQKMHKKWYARSKKDRPVK